MRNLYIVSYDICDPRRLRAMFKLMKGWGVPVQYSVFQCELSTKDLIELQSTIEDGIDPDVDRILFVNVGPATGRARKAISSIGRPFTFPDSGPVVI